MKTKTATTVLAAMISACIIFQQTDAQAADGLHFSGKLHAGEIKAARGSAMRLASMKLRSSSPCSTLRMTTRAQLNGPLTLKKGATLQVASLDMNNARIGGTANLQMDVQVQREITGDQDSEIGIGGMQITADENYNPQNFSASGAAPASQPLHPIQPVNNSGILANLPGGTLGNGQLPGPTVTGNATQGQTPGTVAQGQQVTGSAGKLQPLGQRDPRWKNMKLGRTNLTIGDYGCLITSLAMLKGTTPDKINRLLTRNNGFTSGGYLKHDVAARTLGIGNGARKGKNWKPSYDTIAEVRVKGRNGKSYQHFVVWRTDGTMLDPLTGRVEKQSRYPLVAFRDYHQG